MSGCAISCWILLLLSVTCSPDNAEGLTTYQVHVDASKIVRNLTHFWESTGFCPPLPHQRADLYDLSEDEVQNLALIGSVPQGGIKQVRIHWLLDLVTASLKSGRPVYNFTLLDDLVDNLWQNGLFPGFELMGNPSNIFTDFENKTQVYMWRDLVYQLADRYIEEYGDGYVEKWNFETWNEPDHHDFDNLNFTVQGFLNYYDACSEGLKKASPYLKFGGPGASCRQPSFSKICWALLEHCSNGTNYFTGERGVRLDFISFHKKGTPGYSMTILAAEMNTIHKIQTEYPKLKDVPIYNNEADPLVGWSKTEEWRADVRYAAMVAKVIVMHQKFMIGAGVPYTLLSNDNGFLNFHPNYFQQRTLLARFQMNKTEPRSVQFVRKPVLTVMGLLSLLGEKEVYGFTDLVNENSLGDMNSPVDVLAAVHTPSVEHSSDSWQASVLVYSSNDTAEVVHPMATVQLNLENLRPPGNTTDMMYVLYQLDNQHSNPYNVWLKQGKPVFPTNQQFAEMRAAEDAQRFGPKPFPMSGTMSLSTPLPRPGVLLLHVCTKPEQEPDQTNSVRLHRITEDTVLVLWDDKCVNSRCLLTFEVEFSSSSRKGPYKRINQRDQIFTAFVYSPTQSPSGLTVTTVRGWYRVRAVDYWGRAGEYSLPQKL
ncbi:IDUA [Branchiostoma lanceolatum]|uniref:IDUA protein n=1 Tax=Branchiostoma lanceolatum TaxID=7740 RepID=A0A8J9Z1V9_BRALA|nr:IDUA [Branchiostoma lanceolatum]